MKNIDIALMISLQLNGSGKTSKQYNETIQKQQEEIDSLKKEIERMQQEAAVYVEENRKTETMASSEDIIRLQTQRDTYKELYESLLAKVMAS